MANDQDYVDLGLSCADICKALERGMGDKKLNNLSKSVCDAIIQLTMWVPRAAKVSRSPAHHFSNPRTVAKIQEKVIKRSGRHKFTRFVHSRNDKDVIATWKSDLNRLLRVFNVCSACLRLAATDFPSQDRAYFEHPHNRCRYSSRHVENRGPEPSGK